MIRRNTLLQSNVTEKPLRSPIFAAHRSAPYLNAQNHRSTESHQSRRVNRVFQQPASRPFSSKEGRNGPLVDGSFSQRHEALYMRLARTSWSDTVTRNRRLSYAKRRLTC